MKFTSQKLASLLILLGLFRLSPQQNALATPPIRPHAGLTLMSWDMELYEGAYGIFLDHFVDSEKLDALQWQATISKPGDQFFIAQNYLNHPQAFESLSAELKQQLTEGLGPSVQAKVLVQKIELANNAQLKVQLEPKMAKQELILPSQSIITQSTSLPAPYTQHSSGLLLQGESLPHLEVQTQNEAARQYRSQLIERWTRFVRANPEEALKQVKFKYLSPAAKEQAFRASAKPKELLILKQHPLLDRIQVEWDEVITDLESEKTQPILELKLKKEQLFTDRKAFVKFTKETCEKLQCSSLMVNPRSSPRAGIHYHFTVNPSHGVAPVQEVMKLYKMKNALELIANQEYEVLGRHVNSYSRPIKDKGNLRQLENHHYELREPLSGPETITAELDDLFELMENDSEASLGKARDKVKFQIAELIHSRFEDLKKIERAPQHDFNFENFLKSNKPDRTPYPSTWVKLQADIELAFGTDSEISLKLNALEPKVMRWSEKTWIDALKNLENSDSSVHFKIASMIENQLPGSKTGLKLVARFISEHPELPVTGELISSLSQLKWNEEISTAYVTLLKSNRLSALENQRLLLYSLTRQAQWSEALWAELSKSIEAKSELSGSIQSIMLQHLRKAHPLYLDGKLSAQYVKQLDSLTKAGKIPRLIAKEFSWSVTAPLEAPCKTKQGIFQLIFSRKKAT